MRLLRGWQRPRIILTRNLSSDRLKTARAGLFSASSDTGVLLRFQIFHLRQPLNIGSMPFLRNGSKNLRRAAISDRKRTGRILVECRCRRFCDARHSQPFPIPASCSHEGITNNLHRPVRQLKFAILHLPAGLFEAAGGKLKRRPTQYTLPWALSAFPPAMHKASVWRGNTQHSPFLDCTLPLPSSRVWRNAATLRKKQLFLKKAGFSPYLPVVFRSSRD